MNIVVLAGGISTERQVSFSSGGMVCAALRRLGHNALLLDSFYGRELSCDPKSLIEANEPFEIERVSQTAPDLAAVRAARPAGGMGDIGKNVLEICAAADIVYMGLHGENGENGRFQAVFDMAGIKYTGSGYLGSALAMNKDITKQTFLSHGVLTPAGRAFYRGEATDGADAYGFPCVVKPCSGGSSVGVFIAKDKAELDEALKQAFEYEDVVLVEEYISGDEFTMAVLGDEALPAVKIIPREGFYDYAHKYQPGWTEEICPAPIPKEESDMMAENAVAAYRALKLDVYARMDFIRSADGRYWCLEANTLPGMTPTSLVPQEAAAVGISYDELCEKVIRISMNKYGEQA